MDVARRRMVDLQLRRRGIRDERVLQAFAEVPRERFVPPDFRDEAYHDHPIPIGLGQTISQPYVVALMVTQLAPSPTDRILDVGAGSGYQTAILARLAGHVYAMERLEKLSEDAVAALASLNVDNVTWRTDDGSLGWSEEAPFDGIICGAAAPEIPQVWIEQLADGGKIVAPVGGRDHQSILVARKDGTRVHRRHVCDVRFVKLIGEHGWSE